MWFFIKFFFLAVGLDQWRRLVFLNLKFLLNITFRASLHVQTPSPTSQIQYHIEVEGNLSIRNPSPRATAHGRELPIEGQRGKTH